MSEVDTRHSRREGGSDNEAVQPPASSQRTQPADLALVLSGGGARAAYQVGVLRGLAQHFPEVNFPIITGVSAGAINASYLASHRGSIEEAVNGLRDLWQDLDVEDVFCVRSSALLGNALRWILRLGSGGSRLSPQTRGLVDTRPLRRLLVKALCPGAAPDARPIEVEGIAANVRDGRLKATALTTIDYDTGRTVTWVEGADFDTWERPGRLSRQVRLTVDHILASAALPLLFPAVQLEGSWHGDGGIRLAAPLAPAIHLGANRMVIISTRHLPPGGAPLDTSLAPNAYPPPAQILGKLMNAIFLDLIDQDVARLERINDLVEEVPEHLRDGFRLIRSVVIRPSEDLGRLASRYEPRLPGAFRFMTRGLGTRETSSPDFLSLLMFQPDYVAKLVAIGERDAEATREDVAALLEG